MYIKVTKGTQCTKRYQKLSESTNGYKKLPKGTKRFKKISKGTKNVSKGTHFLKMYTIVFFTTVLDLKTR